jgi:hypothetical protein
MHLIFHMQHMPESLFHLVTHYWVNLHLKGKLFSLHFCWKVHSDPHLGFLREKEKAQESRRILWTIPLPMEEERQPVTVSVAPVEHLLRLGHLPVHPNRTKDDDPSIRPTKH